jgi:hypothetical protein
MCQCANVPMCKYEDQSCMVLTDYWLLPLDSARGDNRLFTDYWLLTIA